MRNTRLDYLVPPMQVSANDTHPRALALQTWYDEPHDKNSEENSHNAPNTRGRPHTLHLLLSAPTPYLHGPVYCLLSSLVSCHFFRVVHHLSIHRAFTSEQQKKQGTMLTLKSISVY